MKVILCLAVFAVLAAVVYGNSCMHNDPSGCTHTCPDGEAKACEREICTCAKSCMTITDCADCADMVDPMGHSHPQDKHCVDGSCQCIPTHGMPDNHHPGQHGGN